VLVCQLSIHGVAAPSGTWLVLGTVVHGVITPDVERLDGRLGSVSVVIGSVLLVKLVPGFLLTRDVATAIARHAA
jgi:hypothetical protein